MDPVTTFTTGKQLTFIGKEKYGALYIETIVPLEIDLKGMWLQRVRQGEIEEGEPEPKISEIGFIMKDEKENTMFYSPAVLVEEHDNIQDKSGFYISKINCPTLKWWRQLIVRNQYFHKLYKSINYPLCLYNTKYSRILVYSISFLYSLLYRLY